MMARSSANGLTGGVANLDVRINGESIVQDGVAEIPMANSDTYGVVKSVASKGIAISNKGILEFANGANVKIDERSSNYAILDYNIDYAVKAAMCDGKGAAWTADEQAAARERMGISDWELVADITLEEEASKINLGAISDKYSEFYADLSIPALESAVIVYYEFGVWTNNGTPSANEIDFIRASNEKEQHGRVNAIKIDNYFWYYTTGGVLNNNIIGQPSSIKANVKKIKAVGYNFYLRCTNANVFPAGTEFIMYAR